MATIIKSPYPNVIIPENISLPEFVLGNFEKYGDKIAMISPKENKQYTYADLIKITHQLANGLHNELGLRKGHVLASCMANSCEFLPLLLATSSLGCTSNPANPAFTMDELVTQYKKSKPRFIVTTSDILEKIRKVKAKCPSIEKIILRDTRAPGCVYLHDLMSKSTGNVQYPVSYASMLDQPMCHGVLQKFNPREEVHLLLSSSGTTGIPKSVMLTHYSTIANLCQTTTQHFERPSQDMFSFTDKDVVISPFPYFHAGGIITSLLWPLNAGATLIIFPRYDLAEFIGAVKKYQMTMILVPPPVVVQLVKSPDVTEHNFRSVRHILCGAAPVTRDLSEAIFAKIKPKYITQGYGMTEIGPLTHLTPVKPTSLQKHGSGGVPVANTDCKVLDIESGRLLGPMQDGEICVRGPQMMKGYLDNPQATRECIDKDAWLHTGDIGHYDEDGYFYIIDRIKELIKVKGFQVAPAELEGLLVGHPSVAEAAVVGILDELKGEIPRAYVVLKNGCKASEEELKKHVEGKVISYKWLEGGVKFINELPKTPSGKLLRRFLRDKAREEQKSKPNQGSKL